MFLSSAAPTERAAAAPGQEAPAMEIRNSQGSVSLASLRGKYVIVNFWSSDDPRSRIANALYDRAFSKNKTPEVACISVCTDETRSLFESIIKADGLQEANQYYHKDSRLSGLLTDYGSVGAGSAFLIDPDGRVVAVNPDVDDVKSVIDSPKS